MHRRVVITGAGVVTPCGQTVQDFWSNIIAGRSGIGLVSAFDATNYDSLIAGEVRNFQPNSFYKNPKDGRRSDRYVQLAMAAAKEAITSSGLTSSNYDPERAGTIVGSGIGGLRTLEDQHTILLSKGPGRISPFMVPMMISNMATGIIAMEYDLRGPNFAVATACASAGHAIGEGWRLILDDEADIVVAGGSEAPVAPLGLAGFASMKALSTRNHEPTKASRPFDRNRDGFVLSEGGGIVVLEELEHAKKRRANIIAELVGYGSTADAYHMTSPDPNGAGAARAMKMALRKAGLNPNQIDYINAHGTSTLTGDLCETLAIKAAFEEHAKKVPVSSTKSMTGHFMGASGAVELVACLKAIETGVIPPTINLDEPDPECDLDYVPNTAREGKFERVMSNSFGFGGHNACLIAQKFI